MPTNGSPTHPTKPPRSLLPEWFRRTAVPLARLVVGIAAITAVVVALFTWIATDGFSGNVVALAPAALAITALFVKVSFQLTKKEANHETL
jgi:hypothetical protein